MRGLSSPRREPELAGHSSFWRRPEFAGYDAANPGGETGMNITIQWPRFLAVSIVGSILMLALYMLWGRYIGMDMTPGYPSRPPDEVKPLVPFLAVVSIAQLVVFCYLYMRVYPQRSLANALWWGAWGGLFMVIPDGQFFVGTPNQGWGQLGAQMAVGIATGMLATAFFQLVYRPKDESWTPVRVDVPRFFAFGLLSAVLVFVLDIGFHQHLAQVIFSEYPAHDYPQRPAEEALRLIPFLFLTYLFQLTTFCYLFLRVYPERGMANALWFGAWLGLWVVIPNMQFFVGLDKYTWHMLAIQAPEGAILTVMMMAFFEWAYRPRARVAGLAAAE
jgi:hypothetical protein